MATESGYMQQKIQLRRCATLGGQGSRVKVQGMPSGVPITFALRTQGNTPSAAIVTHTGCRTTTNEALD